MSLYHPQTMNPPASVVDEHSSEDELGGKESKSRRELPPGAVAHLKAWLLSPEHFTHPYPTPQDQIALMQRTGIDKKQLKNWFTNARRRIWKPMLKRQLEAGKLAQGGGGGENGNVAVGEFSGGDNNAMLANFQRARMQGQGLDGYEQEQFQQPFDQFGNAIYQQQQQQQLQQQQQQQTFTYQQSSDHQVGMPQQQQIMTLSDSIGTLPPPQPSNTSAASLSNQMIKTDSHAVLMELFARDQYLVRQAAGKNLQNGGLGIGNPVTSNEQVRFNTAAAATASPLMQKQQSVTFDRVPTPSSWPHFSSVSSLNNLGGLQGVKSITNLSMADLSSQGNLNKMGNLAQVKSYENMGRVDSYAFLEIFFDDKSGMNGLSSSNGGMRLKREREEDDAIGLSLDGDDGAPQVGGGSNAPEVNHDSGMPPSAPILEDGNEETDGGQLKRAYDDALAARGLIAVRRSCEELSDLALPAKMQRTLSREYIRQHAQGQPMGDFFSSSNSQYAPHATAYTNGSSIYAMDSPATVASQSISDPNTMANNTSVQVPSSTKCALCTTVSVDTQLRPCGHMFHGRCLKPSLQNAMGPPRCPICGVSMQSAILAVPTATPYEEITTIGV